jgi:DNA-binding response OmpR family regulator
MHRSWDDIPYRILLVDDEPQIGDLFGDFLTDRGYEVFYTHSGIRALEFIKHIRPHIVLLDFQMDEMNGLSVLEKILVIDPKVSVIMVTAHSEEEIGREALRLGAVDFITKPVNFEYLDTSLNVKIAAMLI